MSDWRHPMVGQRYRHLNTEHIYQVVGIALDWANNEPLVLYVVPEHAGTEGVYPWSRPLREFTADRYTLLPPEPAIPW